ncbi:MAG: hypothetical protein K8T91_20210 [Planctomycetes bacterium]|nr:hypothetical protein [Planctomycetota bacterium]
MNDKGQVSRRSAIKIGVLGAAGLVAKASFAESPLTDHGLRRIQYTTLSYHLIPYNSNGMERPWDDGELVSSAVLKKLKAEPITDVFIFSHGWRGDYPDAIEQYDSWVKAMAACERDRRAVIAIRPDFQPLLVGLHWPSLPLGDETIRAVAKEKRAQSVRAEVEHLSKYFGNNWRVKEALTTIVQADEEPAPEQMPKDVAAAFLMLNRDLGLQSRRKSSRPGNDSAPFDPRKLYEDLQSTKGIRANGVGGSSSYRTILELLSFWEMKKLACTFGETGAHQLLQSMQRAVLNKRKVRFHLMGHSFGCIVVSCVAGPPSRFEPIPVNSLSLIQGAFSLWSYCSDIDAGIHGRAARAGGEPGYFHRIVKNRMVRGPIITTQSSHDNAVCDAYPWAAWWREQRVYAKENSLPEYGAVGEYGLRGPGFAHHELEMLPATAEYDFQPGMIYNIDSSNVICNGGGFAGAHSDICHEQVGHAVWQAAFAGISKDVDPAPQPEPIPQPLPPPTPHRPGLFRRWRERRR